MRPRSNARHRFKKFVKKFGIESFWAIASLDAIASFMASELSNGGYVRINRLGSFRVRAQRSRLSKTGKAIQITFKASQQLKNKVKENYYAKHN